MKKIKIGFSALLLSSLLILNHTGMNKNQVDAAPSTTAYTYSQAENYLYSGQSSTFIIAQDGFVYGIGLNGNGQLGLGDETNRSSPTRIPGISNAVALKMGFSTYFFLTSDGSVYVLGDNFYKQTGLGTTTNRYITTPTKITSLSNITDVSSGLHHTLFLTTDGSVYSVGRNLDGELGVGDKTARTNIVKVSGISNATAIAASHGSSYVLTADGSVYAFGDNLYGQLGLGHTSDRNVPTKIPTLSNIHSISAGNLYVLFMSDNGDVYSTGDNFYGELGVGDDKDRNAATKIETISDAVYIKASGESSYIRTKKNDWLVAGNNRYSKLGHSDLTYLRLPTKISTLNDAIAIGAGPTDTIKLLEDGSLFSSGWNNRGNLGLGDTVSRSVYTKIPNLKSRTITLDKINPTGNLTASSTTWTTGNITISANGSDTGGAGFFRIIKPDGSYVKNAITTFNASANGTYTFTFEDHMRNRFVRSITVSNIDKEKPQAVFAPNGNQTYQKSHAVKLNTSDATSGVSMRQYAWSASSATTPSNWTNFTEGQTVTTPSNAPGSYYLWVKLSDAVGNELITKSSEFRVDNTPPTLVSANIEGADYANGHQYWVNGNKEFTLRLKGSDNASGITSMIHSLEYLDESNTSIREFGNLDTLTNKSIETKLTNFTATEHKMTASSGMEQEVILKLKPTNVNTVLNYEYRYNMHDASGHNLYQLNGQQNMDTGKKISIDGEKPTGTITQNISQPTSGTVLLTAVGNDGLGSGMKQIRLPNGTIVNNSVATYTVSANGSHSFEFLDQVGNVSTRSVTVSNIDIEAPNITFTPDSIEGDFKDISVQTTITDKGTSGVKQIRYAWTKDESYPTDEWSDWSSTPNPLIVQDKGGKWFLHIEAVDHVGNTAYVSSGIYEKIALSGGPSVNLNVYPVPTGNWSNKPIDVYVMDSGDTELLSKATKFFEVTNSSLYPTSFTEVIPHNKKIDLSLAGENFIHVQYVLDDGTKISSTSGPYLIDTGSVGNFTMKLVNALGTEANAWSNVPLKLVIGNPANASVSSIQKQYRIEGIHNEWQPYQEGMTISAEGTHRVFGRIVNGAGAVSEQQIVRSKMDQTKPEVSSLKLIKKSDSTYQISVKAVDTLSAIKEVRTDKGVILTRNGNMFETENVSAKPTHLTITDHAGNILSPVAFASEPAISFKTPYTLEKEWYQEDVTASFTNATSYIVGTKSYACSTNPCSVVMTYNTTLTAVHTDGTKETRTILKISNIDKTNYQLVLSGKRKADNLLQIAFEWNLPITNGTLSCTENGTIVLYPVSGNSFSLSGKNYTYDCILAGTYKGQTFTSNSMAIYSHGLLPFDGTADITSHKVNASIYISETPLGKSYLINGKSDNYKYNELPIPQNEITSN